jgi:hypothetical protein
MMRRVKHHLNRWGSWIEAARVSSRKRNETNKKEQKNRTKNKQKEKNEKPTKEAGTSKGRDEKQTRLKSAWKLPGKLF